MALVAFRFERKIGGHELSPLEVGWISDDAASGGEFEHCAAREGLDICLSNPLAATGTTQDGEQRKHMALTLLYRRAHRALRTFTFLGLICSGAALARAEMRFDVFLGYDGTVREASWFPIVCEIQNDGPPFTGTIEVTPGGYGKGQSQKLVVELPTGTLKRVVIPAFAPGRYPTLWDVRLLDERGKVRQEQVALRPQRQIGSEIKLIGSLPRTASGAAILLPIKRNQPDMQPAAARFQPAIFPDNPLVIEGLDALYLNSEVAASLRSSQVNAILAWMNAGGHLIVAIEQPSDVTASPWLRGILPVEPKEVVAVGSHPEINDWVRHGDGMVTNYAPGFVRRSGSNRPDRNLAPTVLIESAFGDLPVDTAFEIAELRAAKGEVRDGQVILAAGETPLLVTANRGLGRVTVLTFSPEREPFKSWKNLPTFWTKLAEVPPALYVSNDYYPGYGHSADGIFGAMLDSRQVNKLPVGWLLLLLLVYLVVIGPFDRYWLKRINRPMLTWITFPCYVVFFSGLIYFIGYKLRSGESECNELHLVDVLRNGERAELRGRTFTSIYSPANARYPMASALKYATLRGEYMTSGGGQTTEKAEIVQTGDNFKAQVFVPVWTSQLYVNDWWHSSAMPLVASLKRDGEDWQLSLQNQTPRAVTTAELVVGDNIFAVGEVAAGQSKVIKLKAADARNLRDFLRGNGASYYSAVQERQYAFGRRQGGRIEDRPTAGVVASFLSQLDQRQQGMGFISSHGLDLADSLRPDRALLLAWSPDETPIPPVNQFKTKRTTVNTMWRIPIAVPPQH